MKPPVVVGPEPRVCLVPLHVVARDGELHLRARGRVARVCGAAAAPLARLLPLVDGSRSRREVVAEAARLGIARAAAADAALSVLAARGFLRERTSAVLGADTSGVPLVSRALHLDALTGDGTGALAALSAARVRVVADDPGDAAWAATALVRAGVGCVDVEPFDDAPESAEADGESSPTVGPAAGAATGVVVAIVRGVPFAHGALRAFAARACDAGVPLVPCGLLGESVQIGPLVVPGATACLACAEAHAERAFAAHAGHPGLAAARAALAGRPSPTESARRLGGALAALEAARLLAPAGRPASRGRALVVGLGDVAGAATPIPRDPRCATCGAQRGLPRMRVWS